MSIVEIVNAILVATLNYYSTWCWQLIFLTDQIAIPDFAAGAMENWGLITYRETGLLYNPDFSTTAHKEYVARVIAHELSHMVKVLHQMLLDI